jgi:hypothetical protein
MSNLFLFFSSPTKLPLVRYKKLNRYLTLQETDFLYWRYFQYFIWGITSLVTGILIIQSGQELEDHVRFSISIFSVFKL